MYARTLITWPGSLLEIATSGFLTHAKYDAHAAATTVDTVYNGMKAVKEVEPNGMRWNAHFTVSTGISDIFYKTP